MEILANIDVDDVAVATDFYCRALDLTVGRRFGDSGVELLGASSAIYLLEKPAGSVACNAPDSARSYSRHWTPVHLDFVVPDIQEACARAQAAGATPEGPLRTHAWGHIAVFADPFGHGFCLIQFLNRGYDEIAS
jgi:catechol 2,3-dioxygenase-like lactoylglutathione lyase family enzyme